MLCPFCGYENSKVLESRTTAEKSSIRRRRECENCQQRFTTYEKIEFSPILVLKRNGSREEYSREKLFNSVINACSKCDIHVEIIDEIINDIESSIAGKREVSSFYIGERILEALKELNQIAYIRYLSVFKRYKTLDDLLEEIQELKEATSTV
ncbi:MAG: transcriptional regulator NrdR [Candidatus Melainabacteria bacterium RIFOXYA12_FULL_32_12]|nr:MAG: transcriptional regulator NrdR [Candidatus Melainabacteria bacterium RIFOXYA12_FULL_32_12]